MTLHRTVRLLGQVCCPVLVLAHNRFHSAPACLGEAGTLVVETVGCSPDSSSGFRLLRHGTAAGEPDHTVGIVYVRHRTRGVRPLRPGPFLAFVLLA